MKAAKTIYCLLALLLMVFWAIQCDDDGIGNEIIYEPPPGVIYGAIQDSVSNQPLEAWVGYDSVLDTSSWAFEFADSNGYYRLIKFPAGDGEFYCGKDGYLTQMKEFQVLEGDSTNIDFRLVPR